MSHRQPSRPARPLALLLCALALLQAALPAVADSTGEGIETRNGALPAGVAAASAAWTGQYAYIFGGLNQATTAMNSIVLYDPSADAALPVATMQTPRSGTSAIWDPRTTPLCSGCAYVFGGTFNGNDLDSILVYNPATQTALDLTSVKLPCDSYASSAVFTGTYAYIFSGPNVGCEQGQIVRFDPVARTVVAMNARLPVAVGWTSAIWDPRDRPSAGCDDGCAYVFGGIDGHLNDVDAIYRYNPKTDTVTTVQAHLPSKRYATMAVFDGSRAYIFGGLGRFPFHEFNEIVWYDPTADTSGKRAVTLPTAVSMSNAIWDGTAGYIFGGHACECSTPPVRSYYSQSILRYQPPSAAPPVPQNLAPSASFLASPSGLSVSVDAGASSDSDGSITSYAWEWGDGATGSGVTASHTYANAGTYTVKLTVTDDDGATGTTTRSATVSAPPPPPPSNAAPTASFTLTQGDLTISVDATASTDTDGTITSYAWTWGDGSTGSGTTATHTYATSGTYTVRLTVTDDDGATGTTTRSATVTAPTTNPPPNGGGGGGNPLPPPANQAPTATFTLTPSNLTVTTDASASGDPDGWLTSYAWTWGDGTTGTGQTATHTYTDAGTYTVRLTVTDSAGATATTARSVTTTNPPPPPPPEPENQTPRNAPPVAQFALGQRDLAVQAASQSFDTDGTIQTYAWTWGDGSPPSQGRFASHTYATSGTYTVRLTVTDDDGATATATRGVTVTAPSAPVVDPEPATETGEEPATEPATNDTTQEPAIPAPIVDQTETNPSATEPETDLLEPASDEPQATNPPPPDSTTPPPAEKESKAIQSDQGAPLGSAPTPAPGAFLVAAILALAAILRRR